jgi:predicted transcriptional regulator
MEEGQIFSSKKRDRMEIIAEILSSCKSPQTQTYIRRQTSIPYAVLQNCIMQLVVMQWLERVKEDDGLVRLAITEKGLVFLDKWLEIQKIIGAKAKQGQPLFSRAIVAY